MKNKKKCLRCFLVILLKGTMAFLISLKRAICKKKKHRKPSSIYSERLFLEAGSLYEQKQYRLPPKPYEKFLFLHHNLEKQE